MATYLDPSQLERERGAAAARLASALANPGDDAYNVARERAAVAWLASPSFCKSPSVEEYLRYKETGVLPPWNPGRHTEAKNQHQCESAFQHDLATLKGYREDPWSIGKNVLAGVVNSIVPGSDLGDAGSSGQLIGGVLGGVASLFVNPASLAKNVSMNLGGVLGNILNAGNKFVSSPIGAVATNYLTSAIMPTRTPVASVPTMTGQMGQQSTANKALLANKIDTTYYSPANLAAFGEGGIKVGGKTVTVGDEVPWYKQTAVLVGGGLFILLFGWLLFFRRK